MRTACKEKWDRVRYIPPLKEYSMHSVTAANAHSCCPLLFGAPYRNNVKTDFFSSLAFALARSIRAQYTESQPANLYWRTGEGEGGKVGHREGGLERQKEEVYTHQLVQMVHQVQYISEVGVHNYIYYYRCYTWKL